MATKIKIITNFDSKEDQATRKTTLKPTNLYEEAQRRYDELLQVKRMKEASLEKAPPGKIHVVKSKRRIQFYLRKDTKDVGGTYLPKSEISQIMIYLQKSYDEKVIKLIQKEITILNDFLKKSNNISELIKSVYSDNQEEIKTFINPIDMSREDFIAGWKSFNYVGKDISDIATCWKTNNGEYVRSKSELTIANTLFRYKIPYRYECPLRLKSGAIIYPDFTVLDVRRRKTVYWEHRGMMDDREYAKHAVVRTKELARNGIVLGNNLIVSEEVSNCPLGTDEIELIILNNILN